LLLLQQQVVHPPQLLALRHAQRLQVPPLLSSCLQQAVGLALEVLAHQLPLCLLLLLLLLLLLGLLLTRPLVAATCSPVSHPPLEQSHPL